MKVVINDCYGGFGLSYEALYRLIQMNSKVIKKMSIEEFTNGRLKTFKDIVKEDKWLKYREYKDGFYVDDFGSAMYKDDYVYFLDDDRKVRSKVRSHPDLIKIVEEMGDKASDKLSKLRIIEIPDDVKWEIEEYDGMEWVSEKHRIWGYEE